MTDSKPKKLTTEERIKEMWEILDTATRLELLKGRHSFLDSCFKFSMIVLVWVWIALSGSITAYLVTELVPGFSEWLRTF